MENYHNKHTNFKNRKLSRIYLKGQRGVRKYYDYDKLDELGFDEVYDKEKIDQLSVFLQRIYEEKSCLLI